jgi:hypothetical protein
MISLGTVLRLDERGGVRKWKNEEEIKIAIQE